MSAATGYLNLEIPLRSKLLKTYTFQSPLADAAAIWLYFWLLFFTMYEGFQDIKERDKGCSCKDGDRVVYFTVLILFILCWSVIVFFVLTTKWLYLR